VGEKPVVHLKKLEMRGFKSFGSQRITIRLEKGLTVVTGPNGSGKSNVLDAIRFVLGDLSARSLRTSTMAGVIFDGTQGKPESKRASVALHLDNTDRRIPIDMNSIVIARRVNRSGNSDYFLNGKRISRGQLMDIISMAMLNPSGFNIIMQGTITRLADVTPEERRKVLEDLIGIAEYDAKRAEARVQLRQADMNLRIAAARIGDVHARVERLEEERNDALRYDFIQKEINKLQATLTSYKLLTCEATKDTRETEYTRKNAEIEELKRRNGQLIDKRINVEIKRRKFDEDIVDGGNVRLINLQKSIGNLMANIASFTMEIDSGKASLSRFQRIRDDRAQQLEVLERRIRQTQQSLLTQKSQRDEWKKRSNEKEASHSSTSSKLAEIKKNLEKNNADVANLENALNSLSHQLLKNQTQLQGNKTKQKIILDNVKTLEERRNSFEATLKDFQQHMIEIQNIHKNETMSLGRLSDLITKKLSKKEALKDGLTNADHTIQKAKEAMVEFEAQKKITHQIRTEELALQRINEMGEVGAIPGIFGIVENLIQIETKFQKAVEAASSGWLKSLVVKDFETALRCMEKLKKLKLGRIKVIPLNDVPSFSVIDAPDIEGIISPIANLVKCDKQYIPVRNFIFGYTVITNGEKSAFLTARAGHRAVDLNGDLYQTSGGIIGGYYRKPIETAALVLSDEMLDNLSINIKFLEDVVEKRRNDIGSITDEVLSFNEEHIRRSETLGTIERELTVIKQNIFRAQQNLITLDKRLTELNREHRESEKLQLEYQSEIKNHETRSAEVMSQIEGVKQQISYDVLEQYEKDQTQLNNQINEVNGNLVKVEHNISVLESNLITILIPEVETIKTDINNAEKQLASFQERVTAAQHGLDDAKKQSFDLERLKEELTTALSSMRDSRKEFEEQLDNIDTRLREINQKYEPLNSETRLLELEIQRSAIEIGRMEESLVELHYKRRHDVSGEEANRAETAINMMRVELERLGSVNQLAISQYQEQKDNYKQLSFRQNELEIEKEAILKFIEEIERRKKEAFMNAFNSVNENVRKFFSQLTGGGEGYLKLQNSEDPFAGGIDIFVQFPGKTSRLVAGASGGEKSVTAVAFIFAIQSLAPAPFYVFDEIDAHLDPYNSERLADLLRTQAKDSQFIVMTLRDVLMDRAEKLFGVYIQNGISQIVSIKIAEASIKNVGKL
jgi:chromosome segregation protein